MMTKRLLTYFTIFTGPIAGLMSFYMHGLWTWSLPLYAFGIVPALELLYSGDTYNLTEEEEQKALHTRAFDYLVYAMVPLQYIFLVIFLFQVSEPGLSPLETWGRIFSMGVSCAVIGINVAHELGHRKEKYEQAMSKALLLTSLYMHFFIEHNRGHHKNVSTDDDPASSRRGEILYTFLFRTVVMSYISAWKLEAKKLKKEGKPFFSLHNEMIRFQLIQLALVLAIYFAFGWLTMLYFIAAATIGFLLLEVVNYIEHYGLRRQKTERGTYEKVLPIHSWNSNHTFGRVLLFELSRHSDHHYKASRKYQILRHFEKAPQMPTGYPGMMILSLVPPLWFYVMHKQIDKYQQTLPEGAALA